jgi:hypothetical protein
MTIPREYQKLQSNGPHYTEVAFKHFRRTTDLTYGHIKQYFSFTKEMEPIIITVIHIQQKTVSLFVT